MLLKLDGSMCGIKMVTVMPNGVIFDTDEHDHFFSGKYLINHETIFPGRKALCGAVPEAKGFCFGIVVDIYKKGRWLADPK